METSFQMDILPPQNKMLLFLELSIQTKAARPFLKEWMKDFNSDMLNLWHEQNRTNNQVVDFMSTCCQKNKSKSL